MTKTLDKDYRHVYAVIRIDEYLENLQSITIKELVTVKEIVWNQDKAEQEVERLNQINSDKGCRYFWQLTRLDIEK